MFYKIATRVIRQRDPKVRRHWYQGNQVNLFLDRFCAGHGIAQIHLDWEDDHGRRPCLSWEPEFGSRTGWVDPGEPSCELHHKESPILRLSPEPDSSLLEQGRRLIEESNLEPALKQELLGKLTLLE